MSLWVHSATSLTLLTFGCSYEQVVLMSLTLEDWQKHLCRAFERKRLAHALLFVGDDESNKDHAARFTTKLILCEGRQAKTLPCETCGECKKADSKQHLNVEWVTSESSDVRIDQIREIRDSLKLRSFNAKARFIIFSNANSFTTQAANALLKSLEEPNPNQYFILLGASRFALLKTLSSRCQTLVIPRKAHDPYTGEQDLSRYSSQLISRIVKAGMRERLTLIEEVLKHEADKNALLLEVQKRLHAQIRVLGNASLRQRKDELLKPIEATAYARMMLERNTNLQLTLENWLLNQWPIQESN